MRIRDQPGILTSSAPGYRFIGSPVKGNPGLQRESSLLSAKGLLFSPKRLLCHVYVASPYVKLEKTLIWETINVGFGRDAARRALRGDVNR